jgi:tetratricopeptide (TPR) repeat protein
MNVDDYSDEQAEKKLLEKIAAGSQDPDDYRNLTDLLVSSGRYDEAIALYQQALTLPLTAFEKARLSMELGWIHYDVGQRAQASLLAREALSLLSTEPKGAEVLYCLGASQAILSFIESFTDPNAGAEAARLALGWLEESIAGQSEFEDKPHAFMDAARLHWLLGNTDKAIVYCEQCLGRQLNQIQRVSCLIAYAQALQGEERFVEAEHAIAEAFEYGKNYKSGLLYRLYVERGNILRFINRLPESKISLEQALAVLKSDPYFHTDAEVLGEIYFNLATVYYELGDYQDAISAYSEVLRCHAKDVPAHWTALYWLGRSYEATEDYPKARDCYAEAVTASRATEDDKTLARKQLTWVLAKLDYESGKYADAAAAFEEVVSHYTKADQDYWLAILWLASSYEGLGTYGKARTFYEEVLDSAHTSDPNRVIARNGLARTVARLAYESDDYKQAVAKFEEVLEQYADTDPNHWNTFIWLASCYQGLGNYTKEQECYQQVLGSRYATDHDRVLARRRLASSLGKAYYERKNYPEAVAAFEEVLASCSDDHADRFYALVCLGYSYVALKTYSKAQDCFEKVLASPHAPEEEKSAARKAMAGLSTMFY